MPTDRDASAALDDLRALHQRVDGEAAQLARRHQERLQCRRGCAACCLDDLRVFEVEAERIRRAQPRLLVDEAPGPPGACAMLDESGACRVYEDRPFVCRTQGLPLLAYLEDEDGELEEQRDICPLNAEGEPLESLDEEELWLLGPVELELEALQRRFSGAGRRVKLRSLFGGGPPPAP